MGIKWRRSKNRSNEDDDDIKVEVDLMTGAMRVDPNELLRSKAMRDLLNSPSVKRIDEQIRKGRSGQP